MKKPSPKFKAVLDQFHNGVLSIDQFVLTYSELFLSEGSGYDKTFYQIIKEAAWAAEFYTDDPVLLAEDPDIYVDERQLRQIVETARTQLAAWDYT